MSDETPATLASALAAFQAELPRIGKGAEGQVGNQRYKYADLADVSAAVLPLLGRFGLSFSTKPTLNDNGAFVLEYVLRHSPSGEFDGGSYPLPTGKPQDVGSAITYARRYALSAITGVAPDADDDGASAPDVPDVRAPQWDPVEQEVLRTGWEAEIADAKTDEALADIYKKLQAKRAREISPATFDHLAKAGTARRAELKLVTP